jgi:hypothetical protein
MTEYEIGLFSEEDIIAGGGRYKIPDVDGFFQLSGVQFKIVDLAWVKPTDDYNLQTLIERFIKSFVDDFTYLGELLLPGGAVIGDVKPTGDSTAIINLDEPANKFKIFNRKNKRTTATGTVSFAFKEKLADAKDRRKQAMALFVDYILENPAVIVDIPDEEP